MVEPVHVDCIGDSLTAGVLTPAYPRILCELFYEQGADFVKVHNGGEMGFTIKDYVEFLATDATVPGFQSGNSDYALIMLGTNDTRSSKLTPIEEMEEEYLKLLYAISQTVPKAQIMLGLLPEYYGPIDIQWLGEVHTFNAADRIRDEINPMTTRIGKEQNLPVVDCYTPLKKAGPEAFVDGIHPNKKGNEILAQTWFNELWPRIQPLIKE